MPCLLLLASGCAAPAPIVQTETVTLTKKVYVPVPVSLTQPEPIPQLKKDPDTIDLGITYLETLKALKITNSRLAEIAGLAK